MNLPNSPGALPRYGLGDDDKTRPCVVLFDWNDEDEATVRVTPLELGAAVLPPPVPPADDAEDFEEIDPEEVEELDVLDDIDDEDIKKLFRPRWPGVGRRPGAVALALVLGASLAIGIFAMLGASDAQARATDGSSALLSLQR